MINERDDLCGEIIIDVGFPISEFRKLNSWGCVISDCATVYDMFSEVIRPMLIAKGYTPGSIIDGCRQYIVEYRSEISIKHEEDV